MRNSARTFQMQELWPEAVVVYPQGLPTTGMTDPEGKKPGWQQRPDDQGGRDFKFFDALLSRMKSDYKIDLSKVYAMGHSNGGRFTYLLWAMRPDVFAAFAPSASPALGLVSRMKPKPAFILAGQNDQLVSYASQRLAIEAIKRLLGCPADPSSKIGYLSLFKGKDGVELATYVTSGDHTYAREANPLIVEFFKRQKKS
jgi:polyhydroxybutyrate depolymerase